MSQVATLAKQLIPQSVDCVRLLQLTDSHIFSELEGKLLGLNTRKSFESVLQRVKQEEYAPDLLLATGDLSQDSSDDSYHYILDKLNQLSYPSFWIPGNHDVPEKMKSILVKGNVFPHKRILIGSWQIILLDTSVPGKVYGNFAEQELHFLTQSMTEYPDKHLLVVMHHQPVPVGSKWLDNLGIKNAKELFKIVKKHPSKKCFLWGHVHQDFVGSQEGIQLISTPSTCVQFKPGSEDFSAGEESPGYRYLTLYNDGRIESVVHRVDSIEYTVDYSIKGY